MMIIDNVDKKNFHFWQPTDARSPDSYYQGFTHVNCRLLKSSGVEMCTDKHNSSYYDQNLETSSR